MARFKYHKVTSMHFQVPVYDSLRRQMFTDEQRVIVIPRIEVVFTQRNHYVGYLIQIGTDLHAITVDNVRLFNVWRTTQKNQAATALLEFNNAIYSGKALSK